MQKKRLLSYLVISVLLATAAFFFFYKIVVPFIEDSSSAGDDDGVEEVPDVGADDEELPRSAFEGSDERMQCVMRSQPRPRAVAVVGELGLNDRHEGAQQ